MIDKDVIDFSVDTLFLNRVFYSYKMNSRYLWLLLILLILTPVMVVTFMKLKLVFFIFIILILFSFVFPIFFLECRKYIYSVSVIQNTLLEIRYFDFNKKKIIVEPFENIRLLEYGHAPGAKTANSFKVFRDFGKGHRKTLITQYEILEWSKIENKEKLKEILNKSLRNKH